MYKVLKMNLITKLVLLLAVIFSLSACSNINAGLGNKKGSPKNVVSSYAPELSAAYTAYDEGRLSAAETLFIKYTNKHPDYTEAWFKLGNIYYRTGQYSAAITAYSNVVQQQPKHSKAWYNMALTRIRQAETTLEKGEAQFEINNTKGMHLTSLKKKLRSSIRQYKPVKKSKS